MSENLIHRLLSHQGCVITPSVGPCVGSAISIREFSITPLT